MTDPAPDIDRDVRSAWNETAPHEQWLVEVNTADGYVIATSEKDRSFVRIPVLVGDGIEFGTPTPVVPGYVETPIAASRVVFASRAESRPEVAATVLDSQPPNPILPVEPPPPVSPPEDPDPTEQEPLTPPPPGGVPHSPGAEPEQEVPTDPEGDDPVSTLSTDVRSRLGLAEDADDAAVVAALDALKQKAETPSEPNPEQVAASAAAVAENTELRKEVTVLASQVKTMSDELAAAKAEKAATVKASVLDKAQADGKFAPADRPQWEADYDEAPAAITRVLASIAAGTAVPVVASGYTGTGEEQTESFDDAEYQRLFGEKAGA